jgi:hypothetical protein
VAVAVAVVAGMVELARAQQKETPARLEALVEFSRP